MDTITFQYVQSIATEYAKQSVVAPGDEVTRFVLSERVARFDRKSVLADLGSGSGLDLQTYSDMGFVNLYGVEPSDSFRGIASGLLGAKASIIGGCFQSIPLKDASVDVMVSRYALHYCRDVSVALTDAARVIKTGGAFMAVIGYPHYDQRQIDKHNADGTITHTLFGGTVPITYPLHDMAEYTGTIFKKYFADLEVIPFSSLTLDGVKPGEVSALCLVATRNARPAYDFRLPQP